MEMAHERGPVSGNCRLCCWGGVGIGPGAGCVQAEQSLCQDLGVINAPLALGRKDQPGLLDVGEQGQPLLPVLVGSTLTQVCPLPPFEGLLIPEFPHL